MKNKEYYKDKLYEIAFTHDAFAVNGETGEMTHCENISCGDCLFGYRGPGYCHERALTWLEEEHVEPILDAAEKRYLENVVRPFKNEVTRICKVYGWCENYAHIRIMTKHPLIKNMRAFNDLPFFNVEKMYLGMKPNKEYTLEELGLFKSEKSNEKSRIL